MGTGGIIRSIAYKIPVDTYELVQLTGSYDKTGRPSASSGIGGSETQFYIWTAVARHNVEVSLRQQLGDDSRSLKNFVNSFASNQGVAWPADCSSNWETNNPIVANVTPLVSTISSCPYIFMTPDYSLTVMSLVINMEAGLVTSIVWDNKCISCGIGTPECLTGYYKGLTLTEYALNSFVLAPTGDTYLTGGCGIEQSNCTALNDGSGANACDIKILITWSGTDRFGRNLQTAGLRVSQFAGMSFTSLWESLTSSFLPPASNTDPGISVANIDPTQR